VRRSLTREIVRTAVTQKLCYMAEAGNADKSLNTNRFRRLRMLSMFLSYAPKFAGLCLY